MHPARSTTTATTGLTIRSSTPAAGSRRRHGLRGRAAHAAGAAPASDPLDREALQVLLGLRGIERFGIEEFFDATRRRPGDLRRRHLQLLRRRPPQVLPVDLRDQRLEVFRARELAPSDILREEPQLVALVWIRCVVAPELHQVRTVVDDPAGAVIELA